MTAALDRLWPAAARTEAREAAAERALVAADEAAARAPREHADAVRAAVIDVVMLEHDQAVARIAAIVSLPQASGRERSAFILAKATTFEPKVVGELLDAIRAGTCALLPSGAARRERLEAMRRAAS